MNVAVIFAGGAGVRMNSRAKPKQFLELHGKPILVYTLEVFENHEEIDGIILVMINEWIEYSREIIKKYGIHKVASIVPGGGSGQDSIYMGLLKAEELYDGDSIVLIHDGVRPLIDSDTITKAINCTLRYRSAIAVAPAVETIALKSGDGSVGEIIDRAQCQIAKAPQCFVLKDILKAHRRIREEGGRQFIDSASLMQNYGHRLYTVETTPENIKITTPGDFYIFRAIIDARENSQIFGI